MGITAGITARGRARALALVAGGAIAMGTVGLAAPPVSAAPALTSSAASSVDCSQLLLGEPCAFTYTEHPGEVNITIPEGLDFVTVVLNGASGGGGDTVSGAAGPGGSTVGVIETGNSANRQLTVWLGEQGGHDPVPTEGWAAGGAAGRGFTNSFTPPLPNGGAGGGASGIAYTDAGRDQPLMVAGGGGGAGGVNLSMVDSGGWGGASGDPAQNGGPGHGGPMTTSGHAGKAGSQHAGTQHHGIAGSNATSAGSGGGGGGGGYYGGHAGGAGEFVGYHTVPGPGGGGGGGTSYLSAELHTAVGQGLAELGPGSISIYAHAPHLSFGCENTSDSQPLELPPNTESFAFIAMGGAGEHGHNDAPEGTGAFVTGVIPVAGLTDLQYWVGCSGYHAEGAGYGKPGAGGDAPEGGNDGGRGGGATAIASGEGMLVTAGGGGGSGGDESGCDGYPDTGCGGAGGSAGGSSHSSASAHGQDGNDGIDDGLMIGGDGGCSNCHRKDGKPSADGGDGVSPPDVPLDTSAGGGGGAGYPAGGNGGHHHPYGPGGGGGAGGSYLASIVKHGTIAPSGHYGSGMLIILPIIKPVTDLTVEVTATGAAAGYAVAPFGISAECTVGGKSVFHRTVSLAAGAHHTFTDVPQGARCTVTETGTGGATTPAAPQSRTMDAAHATITMANEFAAGALALGVQSAVVDSAGSPVSGVGLTIGNLSVEVECKLAGHSLVLPDNGRFSVAGSTTWAAGWTGSITGLPIGSGCAIREQVTGGATKVLYSADGGDPEPLPGETLIAPSGSSLEVLNSFATGPFTVAKTSVGNGTPPADATYPGVVDCTFGGQPVVFDVPRTFDVAVGGTAVLGDMPVGAHCTVTETDQGLAAAVGYTPSRTVLVTGAAATDVTIANAFDSGTLLLQVERSGEGSLLGTGYTLHVTCDDGTDVELSTGPEGGLLSVPADAGASCDVTETVTGGATAVNYTTSTDPTAVTGSASVVIPAVGSATVTVHNLFESAPLNVAVAVTGPGAGYSTGAVIDVQDCSYGGAPFDIVPGGVWSYDAALAGGVAVTPRVPVGSVCDVRVADDAGGSPTLTAFHATPSSPLDPSAVRVTIADELTGPTTVEIALDFQVAALEVGLVNEGSGASFANAPFAVQVTCTLNGDPVIGFGVDGQVTVSFAADGTLEPDPASAQLAALPVGAECGAVETATGGATSWSAAPLVATLDADGSAITVTNTFGTTILTISATVAGNAAADHTDTEFVFDADCQFNGLPIPASAAPVTFSVSAGGSRELTLPVGAECTVSETYDERATQVAPSTVQSLSLTETAAALTFANAFDSDIVTVVQSVTGAGAETYGLGVLYQPEVECTWPSDGESVPLPDDGFVGLDAANFFTATVAVPVGVECGARAWWGLATEVTTPAPITIALGGDTVLDINSEYDLGELSVEKQALGPVAAGTRFGFETNCTFPTSRGPVDIPLAGFADQSYSLSSGEVVLLEALHGAGCVTTEVEAHDPVRIAVAATGFEASTSGPSATSTVMRSTPSGVVVSNFFLGSLPLTGTEIGVALWVVLGMLLAGVALVVLVRVRQRADAPSAEIAHRNGAPSNRG